MGARGTWAAALLVAASAHRSLGAEVPTGSRHIPTPSEVEDTPILWWCAQAEHADSAVCKKLKFKQELQGVKDPTERAQLIASRKGESFTEPTKAEIHAMREEERRMVDAFCARPDRKHHPLCQRKDSNAMRTYKRGMEPTGAGGTAERLHERPPLELDRVSEWWCAEGGHADALRHAGSMICASWRYRSRMRTAVGDAAKEKVVEEYRAFKDEHKKSSDIDAHVNEQQQMMAAFCELEAHAALKVCVKWLARHSKTELRRL